MKFFNNFIPFQSKQWENFVLTDY